MEEGSFTDMAPRGQAKVEFLASSAVAAALGEAAGVHLTEYPYHRSVSTGRYEEGRGNDDAAMGDGVSSGRTRNL